MVDIASSFLPRLAPSGPFLTGLTFFGLTSAKFIDPETIVPLAQQTGTPEHPFATLAQGTAALPSSGGTLFCAPAQTYPAEALNIVGKPVTIYAPATPGSTRPDLSQVAFTSDSALGFSEVEAVGVIDAGATARVAMVNSATTQPITCGTIDARGSSLGAVTAQALTESDFASCSASAAVVTNGLTRVADCQFQSTLDTGHLLANDSVFGDNVTVTGNASVRNCSIGGNLSVFGGLTIDASSYWAAISLGRTITAGSIVILEAGSAKSQLGWNPAADAVGDILSVLPAGHPPGIYQLSFAVIVNANATAFTDLTLRVGINGVFQNLPAITPSLTAGATPRQALGAESQLVPVFTFSSNGTAAVVAQLTATGATGTPNLDVYASATLLSQ